MNVKSFYRTLVDSNNQRSAKAKKNILQMIFYKGGLIIIGLLLVPVTINYVDSENYGLWLTLSSMIGWMSFFDIGINNGLKNRLTQALAEGDIIKGKKYVSTTYALLCLIFIPLMIVLLICAQHLDWYSILSIPSESCKDILLVICILISYFCLNFILSTINVVIIADQKPADASLRTLLQQLLSLIIIWVLSICTEGSLIYLCLALCAAPLLVVMFFNITLFHGRYKEIAPSFSSIDFRVAPDLMKLGIQFFIIQIAAIIQYQMINFLIMRYYGATEVTSYNVAFNYFKVLTMFWGILTTPIWAAVTDAIANRDYKWIKNMQQKYLRFFCLIILAGGLMLLISPYIYSIWVGDAVDVSLSLSTFVLIYNMSMMFGSIFVNIVNGSGHLKVQMMASLISPAIFILTFYICNRLLELGIISVLIAAIVSNFNGLFLAPIQCHYIIKGNHYDVRS